MTVCTRAAALRRRRRRGPRSLYTRRRTLYIIRYNTCIYIYIYVVCVYRSGVHSRRVHSFHTFGNNNDIHDCYYDFFLLFRLLLRSPLRRVSFCARNIIIIHYTADATFVYAATIYRPQYARTHGRRRHGIFNKRFCTPRGTTGKVTIFGGISAFWFCSRLPRRVCRRRIT